MTSVFWSHHAWQPEEEVQLTHRQQPAAADQQSRQAAEGSLLLFKFFVVVISYLSENLAGINLLKLSL